jgi:sporulation protein YlmC with PRC-barrel domain
MKRVIVVAVVALLGLPPSTGWAQSSKESTPTPTGRSVPQVTADSLVGTTVRDVQGKDIGQVSQLLIDAREGKVTSVIIKRGGAFGFGGKDMSVPWEALKIQRDQEKLVVTMQQDMLEQAPRPQRDQGSQSGEQPSASPSTNPQGQPSSNPPGQQPSSPKP